MFYCLLIAGRTILPRVLFVLTVSLLFAACTPPPRPMPGDLQIRTELGENGPMLPLYPALDALKQGRTAKPVVILQIGDSHTAHDAFSGRLRERLQAAFGDGGRGVLPPGLSHRSTRFSVHNEGWTAVSSYRKAAGPFGIAGIRQHAGTPATLTLTVGDAADLGVAEVEVLRQPGGGTVDIGLDTGTPVKVATDSAGTAAIWITVPAAADARTLTVHARGDGPVDVLAWRIARTAPGIVYANLGTIGATAALPDRWDRSIVEQELKHLSPAMIVFAFGTNEGFGDATNPGQYREELIARLTWLREASGNAALIIVGPPDGDRKRRQRTSGPSTCGDTLWVVPPKLDQVRNAEQQAAETLQARFWDWREAMGGACSMPKWVAKGWASKDHVHLMDPGYEATADRLFEDIMQGYRGYLAIKGGG